MSSKFAGLALALDAPARMTIMHPVTGQPLRDNDGNEAWIDVLSLDSADGRKHDRSVIDQRVRSNGRPLTAEQMEANTTEKLALLTKGWHLVTLDGDAIDVECTPAWARELYSMPELSWLRMAIINFAADLGNFRPAASRN